jgi:hypothetical protein
MVESDDRNALGQGAVSSCKPAHSPQGESPNAMSSSAAGAIVLDRPYSSPHRDTVTQHAPERQIAAGKNDRHPQTRSAVATIDRSLACSPAAVRASTRTEVANPHCGDSTRRSSGIWRAAPRMRALSRRWSPALQSWSSQARVRRSCLVVSRSVARIHRSARRRISGAAAARARVGTGRCASQP